MPQHKLSLKAIEAQLALHGLGVHKIGSGPVAAPAARVKCAPAATPINLPLKATFDEDDDESDDNADGDNSNNTLTIDRPLVHVVWCEKKPKGSPGRSGYCLQQVLGMTNSGYAIVYHGIKTILMRTTGIDMEKTITQQRRGLVNHSIRQAADVYTEFDMYHRVNYWPLRAFIHKILRTGADQYKKRLKNTAIKKSKSPKNTEVGEQAITSAEALLGFNLLEQFNNPDITMAAAADDNDAMVMITDNDDAIEAITSNMTRMSVDPDLSMPLIQDDEDDGAFDMSKAVLDPPVSASSHASAPPTVARAQSALAPPPAPARASLPPLSIAHAPPAHAPELAARPPAPAPASAHPPVQVPAPVPALAPPSAPACAAAPSAPPASLDCAPPARPKRSAASKPTRSTIPVPTRAAAGPLVPAAASSSAPALSPTSAEVSADADIASVLTPALLAQLQRYAELPAHAHD